MSDTDSFIREVTEEVRQDRMMRYAKRYGPYVLGAVAAIVLGASVSAWLDARAREQALATGALLVETRDAEPETVQSLVAEVEGEARVLARMRLAQAQAEAGNRAIAADEYRAVAEDPATPVRYGDLARLEAARLDAVNGRSNAARAVLDEMVLTDGAYTVLARELRAVLRLNAGDMAGAREDLRAVVADPTATGETRTRVQAFLATLPPEPASDVPEDPSEPVSAGDSPAPAETGDARAAEDEE